MLVSKRRPAALSALAAGWAAALSLAAQAQQAVLRLFG